MNNFIKKSMAIDTENIILKNNPLNNTTLKSQDVTNNFYHSMDILAPLKDFILHGVITEKSYNSPQINEGAMILPNELSTHYLNNFKDISILDAINIIYTDANSIVFPIRKINNNPCIWHEYGKSPHHDNQDEFSNKLINLGTLSTCPVVSRDFLFKNDKFVDWLMDIITNDIYNEVCLSIFANKKRSPYIENIFLNLDKKSITIIEDNDEEYPIIQNLTKIINKVSTTYRHKSKFFFSRNFFNQFLEELMNFKNPFGNIIYNNNTIFGYGYTIVETMENNGCIFGSLKDAYTIIIKNDQYLERDPLTKKNFIQFFFANTIGGSIVNNESIHVLLINEKKEKDEE